MVGVVMRHLGMIDRKCDDVMAPARDSDGIDGIIVGIYDAGGTGDGASAISLDFSTEHRG
ncbi:MAG: hypothetical protein ACYTFI_24410, partial [Planctomycetota bacterium]|jgi:hypothetical protein